MTGSGILGGLITVRITLLVTNMQTCLCVEDEGDGSKIGSFCKASRAVRLDDASDSCGAISRIARARPLQETWPGYRLLVKEKSLA